MCLEDITLVPLYARDGSVRAYTLIDTADAFWVNQHRWHLGGDERAARIQSGMVIYLHREVMCAEYGDPVVIDHINRQHLDNRSSNLREVTPAQNTQNRSKQKRLASSKYRGVSWKKPGHRSPTGRWCARATLNGIMHHVGYFTHEEDAAQAVRAFRLQHMPYAVD